MISLNKLLVPLFPFLMEALTGKKDPNSLVTQMQFLNIITNEVKKQLSTLILKIAFALVAVGVLIYSLIVLGQYLHSYMLTYQDGVAFSTIFFAIVSIGCIAALIQMFRPEKPVPAVQDLQQSAHQFSFEKIYTNFLEGLVQGVEQTQDKYDRERAESPSPSVKTASPEPGPEPVRFGEPITDGKLHSDSNYRYSPSAN